MSPSSTVMMARESGWCCDGFDRYHLDDIGQRRTIAGDAEVRTPSLPVIVEGAMDALS